MINGQEKDFEEKGGFTVTLYDRSFGTEAAGDYTLPDYQSDIRRVLHVSQTVLPPSKYITSDSVEFNGTVDYQLIYVGGDGGIYSAPLSGEYSFTVPFDRNADVSDDIRILCSVYRDGISARVSAPRRLSIRSRLRANVRILGTISSETVIMAEDTEENIFRRTESCLFATPPKG